MLRPRYFPVYWVGGRFDMAVKRVAVAADVSATPGSTPFDGAASGTWTAGAISVSTYAKLTLAEAETAWKAQCTFSFSGTTPAPASSPITGSSPVTLTATTKKLQGGATHVLVDGDQEQDRFGNKLSVSASGKLRTA